MHNLLYLLLLINCSIKSNFSSKSILNDRDFNIQKIEVVDKLELDRVITADKVLLHEYIEGETIYSIAKKYHKTSKAIIEFNNLNYPYYLESMQIVKIPCNKHDKCYKENLKFDSPIKYSKIDKLYNKNKIDSIILNGSEGVEVTAAIDGVVKYIGYHKNYGNIIVISNGYYEIAYGYLQNIKVRRGQNLTSKDVIGFIGKVRGSQYSGLYMAMKRNGIVVNPEAYFN